MVQIKEVENLEIEDLISIMIEKEPLYLKQI